MCGAGAGAHPFLAFIPPSRRMRRRLSSKGRSAMSPCCAYDPGLFAYLDPDAGDLPEPDLDTRALTVGFAAASLCYALLLAFL